MSDNIFLTASRVKLRFQTVQGPLSVEDLWTIPLTTTRPNKASIETIGADVLARQVELERVQGAGSILGGSTPSPELAEVNLQVSVLRKVVEIRQAENKAKTLGEPIERTIFPEGRDGIAHPDHPDGLAGGHAHLVLQRSVRARPGPVAGRGLPGLWVQLLHLHGLAQWAGAPFAEPADVQQFHQRGGPAGR